MARRDEVVWWPTLEEALGRLTVRDLQLRAKAITTKVPSRKPQLVAMLAEQLEGERLRTLWERLGELEQAAIAEVVHSLDAYFDAAQFRAKYGNDPHWGERDKWSSWVAASPLQLFLYQDVMPDDLLARLQAFVPPPTEAALESLAELPAEIEQGGESYNYQTRKSENWSEATPLLVAERERAAAGELGAVLRLIDAGTVAVSDKTSRPTSAAMRAVAGVLDVGDFYADGEPEIDPIRAFAWPLLVQAAGLAERAGARLRLTAAGRTALSEPAAAALRRAWKRWLDTRQLDELNRVNAIRGQTGKGKMGLTAVAGRRAAIAAALADCPAGRWIAVDELFRYMRASGHDFEVTRNAWTLYICEPGYGSLGYDGYGSWEVLQARYALCVLFEYAATLGVIDIAYVPPAGARDDYRSMWGADDLEYLSRYDGLSYIRLTPLGSYCLGNTGEYAPPRIEHRPAFSVLPTLQVVATDESPSAGDRIMLERYAARVSDRVWELSAEGLLGALEAGGSLDELSEFLTARSACPLPGPVVQLLDDLRERAGRIEDGGIARLIACDDPALATLVANHARTRRLCLLAGERHLVVPAKSERAFRRALRELGYPAPGSAEALRDAA
ncbi:MAG: helicase-associated domain-containing protein [Solirubrobacteraceae bacterium]